jgi:hypothetical protein
MNQKVFVIFAAILMPSLGLGAEESQIRIQSADSLFDGRTVKSKIDPRDQKYYTLPGEMIRSMRSSGEEIVLRIKDAAKLDVDLFIHAGYPGDRTRVEEICASQGTGSTESCRLFPDDIGPDDDYAIIEARAVGGERRTSFELSMRSLRGPRLQGTRIVGDDATPLDADFDLGDADGHEPILQVKAQLTELDTMKLYKVVLPDSLPGPLTLDLIGSRPSDEAMIRIFDAAGFVIGESFEPGVNSAAEIPAAQQGQIVYVSLDSSVSAFYFSKHIDVSLNFRLPSSISDVVMSTTQPIYYRSDAPRSFHLRFSPASTAYMELNGCGDQPFSPEDLGTRVHVIPSSLQENTMLVFFGESLVDFPNDLRSTLLAGQYEQDTMVQLDIEPTASTSWQATTQQYPILKSKRDYGGDAGSDAAICTVNAVVRDDVRFIVPFDPNKASTLVFEKESGQLQGLLSKDEGLAAFRITQRQLEQTGATGISIDTDSEELDIAIVLSTGFVQSVGTNRVRWDWDRRERFAYVILFRSPLETDNVDPASYTLDYLLTYEVPNAPQFSR